MDEPARVTPLQMDRWCRDFGNWDVCDTVCFKLFDQTPYAFGKVALTSSAVVRRLQVRRAAAAMNT